MCKFLHRVSVNVHALTPRASGLGLAGSFSIETNITRSGRQMKGSSDKESGYVGKTKVAGEKKKSEDICEIAVLWCSPRCSATGGGV